MPKTLLKAIATLGLLAFSAVHAADDVIKIGASVSLSGAFSREGRFLRDGYELWKQKANAAGGVKVGNTRRKVEIVYYDDESKAQTSAQLTERLITEDKVDFLFGPYSSGIATATAAISERYRVLTFAPMATANSLYAKGFKYLLTPSPLADSGLHSVLELAKTLTPTPKTVAIVGPDDLFPNITSEGAEVKAKELGFQVVYRTKYPKGAADLSAIATALRGAAPDILLASGYTQDSILLVKSLRDLQVNPKVVGLAVAIGVPDFRTALGPAAEGIVGADYWVRTLTYSDVFFKNSEDYFQAYKSQFGQEPTQHAASGTAAGIILQTAIEKAGSVKAEDVRSTLSALSGETFFGPYKFAANGTNLLATQSVSQIKDGQSKVVFPARVRELEVQYPRVVR